MTYLVTGGAGFIGSNIAETLIRMGRKVRIIDNFLTGKEENLESFGDDAELVKGDIRDMEAVKEAVSGVTYVIHQAALPSVPRSIDDPITTSQVNVDGTLNLLKASLDAGVKRFVYASSSSIYGDSPTLPKEEKMPLNPLSPYAISKAAAELYCRNFYRIYSFETVSLRYFNVFGPRQDPLSPYAGVIPLFYKKMKAGENPTIFGDGKQSRDFTYVTDVVQANLRACEAPDAPGGVFNIGCGIRYTLLDLVEYLKEINGFTTDTMFAEPRMGDVKHSLADITAARKTLGYDPDVSFRDGLEKYCESIE